MNQIMDNIKGRRSRRSFLDARIPENIIQQIIEAGRYAPSGLNKQPWQFVIITDRGAINRLSDVVKASARVTIKLLPLLKIIKPSLKDPQVIAALKKTIATTEDNVFYKAPLLVILLSDKKNMFAVRDCAMAAQNMMLYAYSAGIGSCFIGRADLLQKSRQARQLLSMPHGHMINAAVVFGYPASVLQQGPAAERKKDNIIKWIR